MNQPFFAVNKHYPKADEAGEVGGVFICVGHFANLLSFEIVGETKSNKMESQYAILQKY